MYAPVCTRFRTYGIPIDKVAQAYSETIFADPDFAAWDKAAEAETWTMPHADHM